jgi:nitroreductase/FMN reductase [NAD(P)H]
MEEAMAERTDQRLAALLRHRFGEEVAVHPDMPGLDMLTRMAGRASLRAYADRSVPVELLRLLAAVALAAPSKSDLQQRDIILLEDPEQRRRITSLTGERWIEEAPAFFVFCGNNRRQRQLHEWRGHDFVNDHLDAFFNAAVDGAIVLATFVAAAEAAGLGCCPISIIRNHAEAVSRILELPDHVFPIAGLTVGWPAAERNISLRLPLAVTVHRDRFGETELEAHIAEYDRRRAKLQPYEKQRRVERFGHAETYGWSEDKARQYAVPERADFGAFIRAKGFDLY